MKKALTVLLLLAAGCIDTEENASANLKKGDDFYARKEYEVAEYYYERIPEESPLYAKARVKLNEIAEIKKQWVEKEVLPSEIAKIIITEHTYALDNITRIPAHRLAIVNGTVRNLAYVTIRFDYYDKENQLIISYTVETKTPMYPNTQDVFTNIESGVLTKDYARSTATIVSAKYQ